jgi:hypothetical protein
VTFTGESPIKTTAMSMLDHQSQTFHSNNQWLNHQSSKLFHLPLRFQPQCNLRPSLQQLLHLQSLLLRLHRSQLHKAAKDAPGSRPFQKKTKKKKPAAQGGQRRPRLEAIPEEDEEEEEEPQPQGAGYRSPSSSSSSSSDNTLVAEDYDTAPNTPAKDPKSLFGARGDNLLTELRRLAITPDANTPRRKYEIPADERGKGAPKILGAEKPFQHQLAEAGPPSQRTRQMQKDLEKTLLMRYEESKALEKKKKKEIKKEQP